MTQEINQAIIGIWVTIGLSIIASLINVWIGAISSEMFFGQVIIYSLYCIFPYKIGKGSNPGRWVYSIFFGASVLIMISGLSIEVTPVDWIATFIVIPIQAFVIFRLFQPEASEWFIQPKIR
jgi:hypothetical protein